MERPNGSATERKPRGRMDPASAIGTDRRRLDGIMAKHIARAEKALVEDALAYHKGSRTNAAAALGINRATIVRLIQVHGVDVDAVAQAMWESTYRYQTAPEGAPWAVAPEA